MTYLRFSHKAVDRSNGLKLNENDSFVCPFNTFLEFNSIWNCQFCVKIANMSYCATEVGCSGYRRSAAVHGGVGLVAGLRDGYQLALWRLLLQTPLLVPTSRLFVRKQVTVTVGFHWSKIHMKYVENCIFCVFALPPAVAMVHLSRDRRNSTAISTY